MKYQLNNLNSIYIIKISKRNKPRTISLHFKRAWNRAGEMVQRVNKWHQAWWPIDPRGPHSGRRELILPRFPPGSIHMTHVHHIPSYPALVSMTTANTSQETLLTDESHLFPLLGLLRKVCVNTVDNKGRVGDKEEKMVGQRERGTGWREVIRGTQGRIRLWGGNVFCKSSVGKCLQQHCWQRCVGMAWTWHCIKQAAHLPVSN